MNPRRNTRGLTTCHCEELMSPCWSPPPPAACPHITLSPLLSGLHPPDAPPRINRPTPRQLDRRLGGEPRAPSSASAGFPPVTSSGRLICDCGRRGDPAIIHSVSPWTLTLAQCSARRLRGDTYCDVTPREEECFPRVCEGKRR